MFSKKLTCLVVSVCLCVSLALADDTHSKEGVKYRVASKFPALSSFIDESFTFIDENNLKKILKDLNDNQSLKETVSKLQIKMEKGDVEAEKQSGDIYKELVFLYEWVRLEVNKREFIKNGISAGN